VGATAGTPRPSLQVVLLSTDRTRVTWARQILGHFGHQVVPTKPFFAGDVSADVVLLDPSGVSADQVVKMQGILDKHAHKLRLYGPDEAGMVAGALGRKVPVVPLAFSRSDLA